MDSTNLGLFHGAGALFENPALDAKLHDVMDWLDSTGYGLGEVVDRLQHLAACRKYVKDSKTCHGDQYNEKRRLNLDRDQIGVLRNRGLTYQQIARRYGCSVSAVHKYAHDGAERKTDYIQRSGAVNNADKH